ncbi:hypothetical protein Agub_g12947, partial [Astrephomene gubernaculifera]
MRYTCDGSANFLLAGLDTPNDVAKSSVRAGDEDHPLAAEVDVLWEVDYSPPDGSTLVISLDDGAARAWAARCCGALSAARNSPRSPRRQGWACRQTLHFTTGSSSRPYNFYGSASTSGPVGTPFRSAHAAASGASGDGSGTNPPATPQQHQQQQQQQGQQAPQQHGEVKPPRRRRHHPHSPPQQLPAASRPAAVLPYSVPTLTVGDVFLSCSTAAAGFGHLNDWDLGSRLVAAISAAAAAGAGAANSQHLSSLAPSPSSSSSSSTSALASSQTTHDPNRQHPQHPQQQPNHHHHHPHQPQLLDAASELLLRMSVPEAGERRMFVGRGAAEEAARRDAALQRSSAAAAAVLTAPGDAAGSHKGLPNVLGGQNAADRTGSAAPAAAAAAAASGSLGLLRYRGRGHPSSSSSSSASSSSSTGLDPSHRVTASADAGDARGGADAAGRQRRSGAPDGGSDSTSDGVGEKSLGGWLPGPLRNVFDTQRRRQGKHGRWRGDGGVESDGDGGGDGEGSTMQYGSSSSGGSSYVARLPLEAALKALVASVTSATSASATMTSSSSSSTAVTPDLYGSGHRTAAAAVAVGAGEPPRQQEDKQTPPPGASSSRNATATVVPAEPARRRFRLVPDAADEQAVESSREADRLAAEAAEVEAAMTSEAEDGEDGAAGGGQGRRPRLRIRPRVALNIHDSSSSHWVLDVVGQEEEPQQQQQAATEAVAETAEDAAGPERPQSQQPEQQQQQQQHQSPVDVYSMTGDSRDSGDKDDHPTPPSFLFPSSSPSSASIPMAQPDHLLDNSTSPDTPTIPSSHPNLNPNISIPIGDSSSSGNRTPLFLIPGITLSVRALDGTLL